MLQPLVSEGRDPYLGRQFGGYELIAKIGQGGMGMVYKGRQVSLDRVVAVKILNKALCDNPEFIKRFEREAKSIARVSHPNILAVYDFGQTDGLWYMVTEFIEGSSLASQISERLVLPWEEVAPLMAQCMTGLSFVGQSGVVHRDIKPDNILITKDGTAKIADFGLAKDVSNNNDSTDLTSTGMAMGTPAYMSPEQCMGRKLDVRSDIYSLGITAYLALTGEKPFTGQSSFEIMTKQREHIPPSPRQRNASVPAPVSDLVMRMMAKEPADRCRDAEECRIAWQNLCPRSLRDTPPTLVSGAPVEPALMPSISRRGSGEFYPPPAATTAPADARPGMRSGLDPRQGRRPSQEIRISQEIRVTPEHREPSL
jgi:serine/threonine-protein kinase